MESYWDLYVHYVNKCVQENRKNGIDPHHYEMEWNHWLPKCLFGDQPVGQWLTLRQHAIASALQTIAFKHRCMFGTHIKYLPAELWVLAKPYYDAGSRKGAQRTMELGLGIFDPEHKEKVEAVNMRNWSGEQRSVYAKLAHESKSPEVRSQIASDAAKMLWKNMTEEERNKRSEKASTSTKVRMSNMSKEEKEIYLAPARKSLMKPVEITFEDGQIRVYDSFVSAADELGVTPRRISYLAKNEKSNPTLNIVRVRLLPKG